jgi:uncharacterized ferritin-like protein (DUF455 family)
MRDEVGHVLIGNRWFNWLCEQRQLDPVTTFAALCQRHRAPPCAAPSIWKRGAPPAFRKRKC